MTKKKPPEQHKQDGRKPVPLSQRHVWTLDEIRARCGAEDNEECWDNYRGMHGKIPKTEHGKRFPAVIQGGVIKVLVRRLAWFLAFGEDPPEGSLLVMTKCDNTRCQNPYHAKPMFEKQKCQIAAKKGRLSSIIKRRKIAATRQARHGKLVSGMETAREIRADTTPWKQEPWKRYGISESMFKRIRANKSWIEYDNLGVFQRMAA
jgi:hypothetical protein